MQKFLYGAITVGRCCEEGVGKVWVVPFVWQRSLGGNGSLREGHDLRYQDGGTGQGGGVSMTSLVGLAGGRRQKKARRELTARRGWLILWGGLWPEVGLGVAAGAQ